MKQLNFLNSEQRDERKQNISNVLFFQHHVNLNDSTSDWQKEQLDSKVRLDPAVNCTVLGPSGWVGGGATVNSP